MLKKKDVLDRTKSKKYDTELILYKFVDYDIHHAKHKKTRLKINVKDLLNEKNVECSSLKRDVLLKVFN